MKDFVHLAWYSAGRYEPFLQQLQQLLCLTPNMWEAACNHAKAAVQVSFATRILNLFLLHVSDAASMQVLLLDITFTPKPGKHGLSEHAMCLCQCQRSSLPSPYIRLLAIGLSLASPCRQTTVCVHGR